MHHVGVVDENGFPEDVDPFADFVVVLLRMIILDLEVECISRGDKQKLLILRLINLRALQVDHLKLIADLV